MENESGIEVLKHLNHRYPHLKVLVLTSLDAPMLVRRLFKLGAHGFIVKQAGLNEIERALHALFDGETYLCHLMQQKIVCLEDIPVLSEREEEVLFHITSGKTIKETGQAMGLSPKTIETYRLRMTQKLNVSTTADLTKLAILLGIQTL